MGRKDGENVVAGFAAAKKHLSYFFPHNGRVLSQLPDEVARHGTPKGTVRLSIDTPLPKALVTKLIQVRTSEIEHGRSR